MRVDTGWLPTHASFYDGQQSVATVWATSIGSSSVLTSSDAARQSFFDLTGRGGAQTQNDFVCLARGRLLGPASRAGTRKAAIGKWITMSHVGLSNLCFPRFPQFVHFSRYILEPAKSRSNCSWKVCRIPGFPRQNFFVFLRFGLPPSSGFSGHSSQFRPAHLSFLSFRFLGVLMDYDACLSL